MYPGGIPLVASSATGSLETLETHSAALAKKKNAGKLLIVTGSDLPEDLQKFLETIITAGMKLQPEDCTICSDEIDFEATFARLEPRAVVVFGSLLDLPESISPGEVSEYEGSPVLISRALSELKTNVASKKEFWGQLQEFLVKL